MAEDRHYPNISQAIWLIILLLLLVFALGILVGILDTVAGYSLAKHPAVFTTLWLIAIGLILRRGLKKSGASVREVFPLGPIRPTLLLPMAMTIFGASILLSEMDNLLRTFLPAPSWFIDFMMMLVGARVSLWGSFIALVVVAPLTEELLVRGLILRGFLGHYSVRKAVVASAILFGLLHFNPWQLIGGTVFGTLFAWWFVQTRSLLPCLFGHALVNALPLIASGMLHLEIQGYSGDVSRHITFQPLWFDLVGLLLAVLGVWLLIQAFGKPGNMTPEDLPGAERNGNPSTVIPQFRPNYRGIYPTLRVA